MKVTTTDEMRAIDRASTERFGVPSLTLMENAGTSVAQFAIEHWPKARYIAVVCGKGNNGGDGFVAARKLVESGHAAVILLLADPADLHGDAAEMFSRRTAEVKRITSRDELRDELSRAELIIDAVLGTGFRPPVTGLYADAIMQMNAAKAPVLAVDIPSGAQSDSYHSGFGDLRARANAVVTFTAPRPSHVFDELTRGLIHVSPIGSPDEAIVSNLKLDLITPPDFAHLLAPRERDGHKGTYGHVLVIGGSVGKSGAAAMAGMSALRAGTGLATIATPAPVLSSVASFAPELMTEPLVATDAGSISAAVLEDGSLVRIAKHMTVIAIGPGISRHKETEHFVRQFIEQCKTPLVVDADALNAFEDHVDELKGSGRTLVITPHPGEMARLTGMSTKDIQANRIDVARRFAGTNGVIVVLKGHRTLVALPDGHVWVNPTGNPGMASGGSGDVLTGIIAGVLAQHTGDAVNSVIAAVYLHGLAGDVARDRVGEPSLIATDIIAALPEAFARASQQASLPYVEFR